MEQTFNIKINADNDWIFRILINKKISYNGDTVEIVISKYSPLLSQDEVERPKIETIVTDLIGHVGVNNNITLTISFNKDHDNKTILVTPEYAEWILGYVSNTLNEFDESGHLITPDSISH